MPRLKSGRTAYAAGIRICDAGHIIAFRYDDHTVTEVTASRDQLLPQKKRCLEKSLRGCRDESMRFDGGLRYCVSYQLERLDPGVFLNFHEELLSDCKRSTIAHRFPVESRLCSGALESVANGRRRSEPARACVPHFSRQLHRSEDAIAVRTVTRDEPNNCPLWLATNQIDRFPDEQVRRQVRI